MAALKALLHKACLRMVHPLRAAVRTAIAGAFRMYLTFPTQTGGVAELLHVFGAFVSGFEGPPLRSSAHRNMLLSVIMPLHFPDSKINGMTATIGVFHEKLTYVVCEYLRKDPALFPDVVSRLLQAWPTTAHANSPKEVLLLHELEKVCEFATPETWARVRRQVLVMWLRAVGSLHHVVSERASLMWRNDLFVTLTTETRESRDLLYPMAMPMLMAPKSWNATVNKMRKHVLLGLMEKDEELFSTCCNAYFGTRSSKQPGSVDGLARARALAEELEPTSPTSDPVHDSDSLAHASVPGDMESVTYFDFVFGHELGKGAFSTVRYAKKIQRSALPSTWKEVAIKTMDKAVIAAENYMPNVTREIQIMHKLRHPNITRLLAVCESAQHVYLVLEYAAGGDLHTALSKMGSLDVASARFVMAEVILALEECHNHSIVYGDLKPENCLIHSNGHIKLVDFGSARYEDASSDQASAAASTSASTRAEAGARSGVDGTSEYLAVEVVEGKPQSRASDVWSVGIVLYQLLVGHPPVWSALEDQAAQCDEVHDKIVRFDVESSEVFPDDFDEDAKDLVRQLLARDPAKRPSLTGVKQHAFFSNFDWDKVHEQKAPVLQGGTVEAAPDAAWSRRRFSMRFSPMPASYEFSGSGAGMRDIPEAEEDPTIGFFIHSNDEDADLDDAAAAATPPTIWESSASQQRQSPGPSSRAVPPHQVGNPFAISFPGRGRVRGLPGRLPPRAGTLKET